MGTKPEIGNAHKRHPIEKWGWFITDGKTVLLSSPRTFYTSLEAGKAGGKALGYCSEKVKKDAAVDHGILPTLHCRTYNKVLPTRLFA